MPTIDAPPAPAVLTALACARASVRAAAEASVWSLSDEELGDAVSEGLALAGQVEGCLSALLAEVEGRDLTGRLGAPATTAWLRDSHRLTPNAAAAAVRRAGSLHGWGGRAGQPATGVAAALDAGSLLPEQAQAILDVLAAAPASATAAIKSAAEERLLENAAELDARGLRRLGTYIWEVVDPDAADAAEAERLEAAEQRAHDRRRLSFVPVGDGMTSVAGRLPDLSAAIVRAALDPLAAPLPSSVDSPDPRSAAERCAYALVELARRSLAGGDLPDDGGERPRLVITVPHTALPGATGTRGGCDTRDAADSPGAGPGTRGGTGIARLDDELGLAPSQLRQIACDGESQTLVIDALHTLPLWMSRRSRLVRGSVRRALVVRDGGCAFPSCDRPAQWCDAHHITFWSEGGQTSLANCVLLCGFHHRLVHKGDWQVVMASDGHPDFVPPPWIDPRRQPRRQRRHRPSRT